MTIEQLNNLERIGKIEKEEIALSTILAKFALANDRYTTANLLLFNNYSETTAPSIFSEFYQSYRILCSVMLAVNGYRVKRTTKGHHDIIINSMHATFIEVDNELDASFINLSKLARRRSFLEYTGGFQVSLQELKGMSSDIEKIKQKVSSIIEEKKENKYDTLGF